MADEPAFRDLVRRVRAGDAAAAEELVRQYEPVLRRMARVRLVDARLRRLVNASDICQSVFASFFVRAALGQYELQKPADLLRLLAIMTRNKVVDKARHPEFARPAAHDISVADVAEARLAPGGSPSQQAALQELVEAARRRLTPEERRIQELRQQGLEWAQIGAEMGQSPEVLRKRYSRAVTLVAEQLGFDVT